MANLFSLFVCVLDLQWHTAVEPVLSVLQTSIQLTFVSPAVICHPVSVLFSVRRVKIWSWSWRMPHTGWSLLQQLMAGRCTFTPTSSPDHVTFVESGKFVHPSKNVMESASTPADEMLTYFTSTIVHNSCKSRSADYDIVGGDALGCQFSSILQTTGLQYRDFIHVSFHNQVSLAVHFSGLGGGQYSDSDSFSISVYFLQVYEIPFFVALDHKREAVLVAVRGTLSLKVSLWIFSFLFVLLFRSDIILGQQCSRSSSNKFNYFYTVSWVNKPEKPGTWEDVTA